MSKAAQNFMFKCDPEKNIECKKTGCYLNGGPCKYTRYMKYAKDPSKVTLIIPTDGKELPKNGRKHNV
jgi:hypothetical protein